MDSLIPIVNKLQDVFSAIGEQPIDLPQIVVIGAQSSGKSSVLEHIVGRDFLPRGTGIVTRRPLVLQLYNTNSKHRPKKDGPAPLNPFGEDAVDPEVKDQEWGEFLHIPGRKFLDFNEIRNEIIRETDRLTGRNKGISNKSINLKLFSPKVLNLTLVDLPGITKVSVGDQPLDIEDQIREMCLGFIKNARAIILAITPANSDLANSDALKLAREVDPLGDRTIGVLTKIDLMDPGTDAGDMLSNRVIPLRRGYVGVINRGQLDIEGNMSVTDSLERERRFFTSHPVYKNHIHRLTTPTLAKNLNQILIHHIRNCLPDIKHRIADMMADVQNELMSLGEPISEMSGARQGTLLLTLLSKYAASFHSAIDGKSTSSRGIEMNELYGGARISFIFHEIFRKSLEDIDPFDGLSDLEIRTAICNANGTRPSLFVPEISFDLLVKRQISRLEQPGLQCADLVHDELQRIAAQCETTEMSRFPGLKEKVLEALVGLLRLSMKPTQDMISNLVRVELAYINTRHPDFIGGSKAVAQLMHQQQQPPPSPHVSTRVQPQSVTTPQQRPATGPNPFGSNQGIPNPNYNPNYKPPAHSTSQQRLHDHVPDEQDAIGGFMSMIFGGNRDGSRRGGQMSGAVPNPVKLPQVPETMRQPEKASEKDAIETEIIKSLIASYFNIARKNFLDLVPKTIMAFLVNSIKESLQNELVSALYKEDLLSDLMKETSDIALQRSRNSEMFVLLQKAMTIVNEVRDLESL